MPDPATNLHVESQTAVGAGEVAVVLRWCEGARGPGDDLSFILQEWLDVDLNPAFADDSPTIIRSFIHGQLNPTPGPGECWPEFLTVTLRGSTTYYARVTILWSTVFGDFWEISATLQFTTIGSPAWCGAIIAGGDHTSMDNLELRNLMQVWAAQHNTFPFVFAAFAIAESGGDQRAYVPNDSGSESFGLFQLKYVNQASRDIANDVECGAVPEQSELHRQRLWTADAQFKHHGREIGANYNNCAMLIQGNPVDQFNYQILSAYLGHPASAEEYCVYSAANQSGHGGDAAFKIASKTNQALAIFPLGTGGPGCTGVMTITSIVAFVYNIECGLGTGMRVIPPVDLATGDSFAVVDEETTTFMSASLVGMNIGEPEILFTIPRSFQGTTRGFFVHRFCAGGGFTQGPTFAFEVPSLQPAGGINITVLSRDEIRISYVPAGSGVTGAKKQVFLDIATGSEFTAIEVAVDITNLDTGELLVSGLSSIASGTHYLRINTRFGAECWVSSPAMSFTLPGNGGAGIPKHPGDTCIAVVGFDYDGPMQTIRVSLIVEGQDTPGAWGTGMTDVTVGAGPHRVVDIPVYADLLTSAPSGRYRAIVIVRDPLTNIILDSISYENVWSVT